MALVHVVLAILGAAAVAVCDECLSQPSVGLCKALIPRYFYNATSGQCEPFMYGGCGGNENNHESRAACQQACDHLSLDECSAEAEYGVCDAYIPRYHFDVTTGVCNKFIYGGCGGNKNNFDSYELCQKKCGRFAKQEPELTLEECSAEAETGLCRAYIPSYAFNPRTGKCEFFVYGGCGGNANRFASPEHCLIRCGKYAALPDPEREVLCTEEPETGLCKAAIPRYFWNHRLGRCQKFTYGGCGGNTNSFGTEEECHANCNGTPVKEVDCTAQPESGLCLAYDPSYFYNATTNKCEKFVYGGCGGNGNRFHTILSCLKTCQTPAHVEAAPAVSVCAQPKIVGPCRASMRRFYYNSQSGSCEQFIYGGCSGNDNNFHNQEDCHNTCLA